MLSKNGWNKRIIESRGKVKSDLTFEIRYENEVSFITAYEEDSEYIYTPRYYGNSKLAYSTSGLSISIPNSISLREQQEKAIVASTLALTQGQGGVLILPCGFGKTVLAIKILTDIVKKKTAILVDRSNLLHQWKDEIKRFTGYEAGIVQEDTRQIDKDIVIFMAPTLSNRPLSCEEANQFGLLIVDECDVFAANSRNKTIGQFPAKVRLGLTATEHKGFGLDAVYKLHLGEVIYRYEEWLVKPTVLRVNTNFRIKTFPGAPAGFVISKQGSCRARSEFIMNTIVNPSAQAGRNIIVLSDRIAHLTYMDSLCSGKSSMFIRDAKASEIPEDASVVFASWPKYGRAVSIERMDFIVLTTMRRNVKQAAGRVVRKERDHSSFVVDLVDNGDYFEEAWERRKAQYLRDGWPVYLYNPKNRSSKSVNY